MKIAQIIGRELIGLLKIISKLGISLISSYRGSQLFEIVGLSNEVVDKCFTNTDSRIGGKNFRNLENENRNISFAKVKYIRCKR